MPNVSSGRARCGRMLSQEVDVFLRQRLPCALGVRESYQTRIDRSEGVIGVSGWVTRTWRQLVTVPSQHPGKNAHRRHRSQPKSAHQTHLAERTRPHAAALQPRRGCHGSECGSRADCCCEQPKRAVRIHLRLDRELVGAARSTKAMAVQRARMITRPRNSPLRAKNTAAPAQNRTPPARATGSQPTFLTRSSVAVLGGDDEGWWAADEAGDCGCLVGLL